MLGKQAIERLRPLLDGDSPSANGEWSMHCPFHGDSKRSASVNIKTEEWYCHGCGAGGEAREMIRKHEEWDIPINGHSRPGRSSGKPKEEISEAVVDGWASALMANFGALEALMEKRGLNVATIKKYEIGYDGRVYTIPIRDFHGEICNVRRYDINVGPDSERRKIWSVDGMGTPSLYPMDQLDRDTILICEGEFDALLAIQHGIPAITRTGTADHWKTEWGQLFRGKRVYVCHDMDEKGQHGNDVVVANLRNKALTINTIPLPYEITKKNGKDITDYLYHDGHSKNEFIGLIKNGKTYETLAVVETAESPSIVPVSVMDSFDGNYVERPLAMQVTVTGKRIPSYLVPKDIQIACDLGAGAKCKACSMPDYTGARMETIGAESSLILGMINVADAALEKSLFKNYGVVNCGRTTLNVIQHRTVEEIYVRPSIEINHNGQGQDFTHRKVISTASHDLGSNQTVDIVGTIRPDPNKQTNEFQAWMVNKPKNTLDTFEVTPEINEMLCHLQDPEDPLGMAYSISDDLASHVTKIYHRPEMHVFMDCVIHSGLQFRFGDEAPTKGWIDAIIIGDTRTGKSEAAAMLIDEYGMGEMISCESATYAGVVGGLDKTGDGQWIVKWGSIPVNDRRAVVMDEVSGLTTEQIAQMSSIRSSGVAEMTKIQNERAMARTRLLWLANPRNARMDDYTFGVQALQPLIGNNEDIARFDMAMGVFSRDVSSDLINTTSHARGDRKFDTEMLQNCIRWAWTRKCDQIVLGRPSIQKALQLAKALGDDFIETPPLIQAANVRLKLTRVAVALAMRTYSTDAKHRCVVTPVHMEAADLFLRTIYGNSSFGYGTISDQRISDRIATDSKMDEILDFIIAKPGLIRFLKHTPVFDKRAIETVMNVPSEVSGGMINQLWDLKAITFEENKLKMEPQVLARIREMQQ